MNSALSRLTSCFDRVASFFAHINYIQFFVLVICYRVALDLAFVFFISQVYGYFGMTLAPTVEKVLVSYVALLILIPCMDISGSKVSGLGCLIIFFFLVIPMGSFYGLSDHAMNDTSVWFFLVACLCFGATALLCRFFKGFDSPHKPIPILFDIVLPIAVILSFLYFLFTYGFHPEVYTLHSIYDIRAGQEFSGVWGYIRIWMCRIVIPLLIVRAYVKKKKAMLVLFVAIQILLFGILPYKEILFSIPAVFAIIFILKRFSLSAVLPVGLIVLLVISCASYAITDSVSILSIFPERLPFVSAQTQFQHYDYFSSHPFLYFSEGVGRYFGIPFPFGDKTTGNIIAYTYQGIQSDSNTGYLAYGYDDLGFAGMVLMSALLVVTLIVLDSFGRRYSVPVVFAACFVPLFALVSGGMIRALWSGGLFVLLVLLVFLDVDNKSLVQKEGKHVKSPKNA